jgi:hypothetical protein
LPASWEPFMSKLGDSETTKPLRRSLTPTFVAVGIQDLLCDRLTTVCKGHNLAKEEL